MEQKGGHKIGVMGGTFNPVHYGHLLIAENAFEQFSLDKVVFMPTGHSPHKDEAQILDAAHRSEMIKLAIADNPHFSCSDYEVQKDDVSYTYLTLQAFHERFPGNELYFIMGADSLAYLDRWQNPKEISELCIVLAAVRDGLNIRELTNIQDFLHKKYGTRIAFINTPNFSVSSCMIRSRVEASESIRYLVPDAVEQYIKQHGIYSCKGHENQKVEDERFRKIPKKITAIYG